MVNLNNLLKKHNLSLKKAFGQNFLSDDSLLEQIVENANITENDTVLEIGCGAGTLTRAIAKKAKKVVGYEIDTRLKPVLNETLAEFNNVEIVFSDVMKNKIADVERKLGGEYTLVANLPYYITTPIIMRFIEQAKNVKALVVMVQEEVAIRLASKPNSTDYGAITVAINLRGDAEVVIRVPREKFTPAPNVDSAVVKINVQKDKFNGVDLTAVREVVKCAFTSRRKMLVNNLMNGLKMSREQATCALQSANIDVTARAENLSSEDYVNLTKILNERK